LVILVRWERQSRIKRSLWLRGVFKFWGEIRWERR
jgi:hypothetical protein